MLTWNLFNAELLKARKMSINIILIGIVSLLGLILLGGLTLMGLIYGNKYIGEPTTIFSYPSNLYSLALITGAFSVLISIVYSANTMGTEYNRDTWKMILPRYGSRIAFLQAKLSVALLMMLAYIGLTVVFWLSFNFICTLVLRIPWYSPPIDLMTEASPSYCAKSITITMIKMSFYGLSTMLVAIAFRSVMGGVLAGIGLSIALNSVGVLPTKILVKLMPTVHIDNISAYWTKNPRAIEAMTDVFGQAISPSISLGVVFGSMLIIISLMFYLFHRRDMAGLG